MQTEFVSACADWVWNRLKEAKRGKKEIKDVYKGSKKSMPLLNAWLSMIN